MYKQITAKRIAAFALAVVMTVALMPVFGMGEAQAATPKGRLVKTVTVKYYDRGTKSWEKDCVYTFKYNKHNDPSLITKKLYNDHGVHFDTEKWTEKYKYKNGKRRSRTEKWNYDSPGTVTKWTYDKYGNPKTRYYKSGTMTTNQKYTFKKSGYIKAETMKEVSEENTDVYKYKYKTSQKRGLLTKMVCYCEDNGSWKKDSTYKFNKKGLVTRWTSAGGTYYHPVQYTYKKGRVVGAKVTFYGDPENIVRYKYSFTYTKKPVKKKRYAKMINEIIESDVGFSWY